MHGEKTIWGRSLPDRRSNLFSSIHKIKESQGFRDPKVRRGSHPGKFFKKRYGHSVLIVIHCISNIKKWTEKAKNADRKTKKNPRRKTP